MKEYLGWAGDSRMAATYVHLSGRNVDNALFKLNGIKTEDEVNREERPLRVQQCERCRVSNPPTNRFCSRCGSPLDIRTALEVQREQDTTDQIMNRLFEDHRFREVLEQALRRQQPLVQRAQPLSALSSRKELGLARTEFRGQGVSERSQGGP